MALIVEHHEELETDLLSQGHDLLDFWRGRITPRRMRVLLGNLPVSGRLISKLNPEAPYHSAWAPGVYVLADLFDAFARVHFENPTPYPRPLDQWRQRVTDERVAQFLVEQAERNKQRDARRANVTYLDERR